MSNYITTLEDKDDNGLLPRTVLNAISDGNGNYLDNQLTASDVNALKNGKMSDVSSKVDSLKPTSYTVLLNKSYAQGSSSWVANDYAFDLTYKKYLLFVCCSGGTRNSIMFTLDDINILYGVSGGNISCLSCDSTWNNTTSIMAYVNDSKKIHVDTRTASLQTQMILIGFN